MVARNSSLASWSKSCPWMMRICLRKVDLPLSPAPSKSIFTSRFTYVLSFEIHLSISLDILSCSASLVLSRHLGKQMDRKDRDGRKSAIFVTQTFIYTSREGLSRAELPRARAHTHAAKSMERQMGHYSPASCFLS